MTITAAVLIFAAGFLGGAVNAIVGSGSLITFPTLLAVGFPPIVANVSNTVGMVFGGVSGVVGYRRELRGQGRRIALVAAPCVVGAATGATLLLVLPQRVFRGVVPVLIVIALLLVVFQPRLSSRLTHHVGGRRGMAALIAGVFLTAIYGGYFGAAQGVILMGLLTVLLTDSLQRLNGLKNVMASIVNGVAAVYFIVLAHVDWRAAGLIAVSSTIGGQAGSLVGRRLNPNVLRGVIIAAGCVAVAKLVLSP